MRKRPSLASLLLVTSLTGLVPVLFCVPASATLIDIVVLGTWESTNVNPSINKFGFSNGDKFVMKSTYDDTTLFNGSEGVTAAVDPTINAGTSFEVIIPHAAGAPNPLEFDHTDHTDIGFAANAEIEFDGSDATTDPGSFRNFEIHVDFSFAGDDMDFDTFMGAIQPETDMFNISSGGNLAAVGDGAEHLEIVTNDMTADAGGPYVFDASNLSVNVSGSSGGGETSFEKTFDWTGPGGALANSPGQNIVVGLAESGLTNTTDTSTINLTVTESFTDFASSPDAANVSYTNVAPEVLSAMGVNEVDDSITLSATSDDADLIANALIPSFELVDIDFLFEDVVFLEGEGNVDLPTLLTIFGSPGIYEVVARATDLAGLFDSLPFNIEVVPEPGTAALLGLGLAGLAGMRRSRGAREGS